MPYSPACCRGGCGSPFLLCGAPGCRHGCGGAHLYAAAQDLRVGPRRLAAVGGVVGADGEQGGVDARQPARKVGALVAPEVDVDAHGPVAEAADLRLDGVDVVAGSDHIVCPPPRAGGGASCTVSLPSFPPVMRGGSKRERIPRKTGGERGERIPRKTGGREGSASPERQAGERGAHPPKGRRARGERIPRKTGRARGERFRSESAVPARRQAV